MPRSFIYSMALESLPVEIICHILDDLEMHDLLACTTVSKHLRKVVSQSSRLQYSIELERARMVSLLPPSSSPPFASRLKLLRARESNWKYLNWTNRHVLSLPPTGSVYEFVGGLYGNGKEDESRTTASISFLELPSSDATFLGEPQKELKSWTHSMQDVNIIDFTMDPSQDLLVLVALAPPESKYVYELHLRSIKTNKPHHKAPVPTLPCWLKTTTPVQPSDLVAAVRVQVAGNLVALLIKEIQEANGAHLEIWNWETHPQYSCALTRPSGIDDFTFLTHDTFLLVRPAGRFEVHTFTDPSTCQRSTTPVLRVVYSFPPLSLGYMYWYISMSSNPAPGYVPRPRTDSRQDDEIGNTRQIYYPRSEERIHACCLYIFNPASEENAHVHSFVFFLNLQTLLNPPTEWIAKAQSNASKSVPSKRPEFSLDTSANTSSPGASSSSSSPSPVSAEMPIHGLPSQIFLDSIDTTPPFIPPQYPEEENGRYSPQYPLFPTFDYQRSSTAVPNPRYVPRVPLHRKLFESKQPPRRQRTRPATSSLTSIPPNTEISWDIWGPQSTRWFEECLSTDWQHAIYGLRTVESININHPAHRPDLVNTNLIPPPISVPASVTPSTAGSGLPSDTQSSSSATTSQPSTSEPAAQSTSTINNGSQEQGQDSEETGDSEGDREGDGDDNEQGASNNSPPLHTRRHLRVRNFNPYSFTKNVGTQIPVHANSKNKTETLWRQPRLVTEASTTPVRGVFTQDIVSSLPYMEIVSRETFEVTDVMMDDSRLLLLKRGQGGTLKRVEVLTI